MCVEHTWCIVLSFLVEPPATLLPLACFFQICYGCRFRVLQTSKSLTVAGRPRRTPTIRKAQAGAGINLARNIYLAHARVDLAASVSYGTKKY